MGVPAKQATEHVAGPCPQPAVGMIVRMIVSVIVGAVEMVTNVRMVVANLVGVVVVAVVVGVVVANLVGVVVVANLVGVVNVAVVVGMVAQAPLPDL